MRRKMIIGAIGATALTIGLGVGATLDAIDSTPPTTTGSTTMMDGTHMNDAAMSSMMDGSGMTAMMGADAMAAMMDGSGMASMMGADAMAAMHEEMHQTLDGDVPADVLAACDEAHASMTDAAAPSSTDVEPDHAAHHGGGQP